MILLSVNLEMVLAKLNRFPKFVDTNSFNDKSSSSSSTRVVFYRKQEKVVDECLNDLGLIGECFIWFWFRQEELLKYFIYR